jgi:hypothetical protein
VSEPDGMRPCRNCGVDAYLDALSCCSARCDAAVESRFVGEGHNHGPTDPPEDCPHCGASRLAQEQVR